MQTPEVTPSAIPSAITTIVPALGRVNDQHPLHPCRAFEARRAGGDHRLHPVSRIAVAVARVRYRRVHRDRRRNYPAARLSHRIAAGVLFLFALATAVFFHSNFGDQNQFIHFFKNIAIAGGLLHVVAFGGGRVSLDGRRS